MTTRAQFLKGALQGAALAAGVSTAGASAAFARRRRSAFYAAGSGPNIVAILTDDQPAHTLEAMPKTRALFAPGVDLSPNAYVSVPVCGPARVGLLTGKYAHNHGALTNETSYDRYRSRDYAADDLLSRMKAAGYRTGYFGKFLNGAPHADEWVHPACGVGYGGRWVAFAGQNHKVPYLVNFNGRVREERQNQNVLLAHHAGSWIREVAGAGPFFAYVSVGDPHGPFRPTAAHEHHADGAAYSSPGVLEDTPEELADKSAWTGRRLTATPATHQATYEGQLEELQDVEDLVEKVAATLSELGILENTLITFATDNGLQMGEHGGLAGKGLPYQESTRTPFLVRGPGVPGSIPSSPLVSHLDLTATYLDAAGADTSGLDGRSLLPLFANPSAPWRERLLVEHRGFGWSMLREGPHAYAELPMGEAELYDLEADPHELENLLHEPTAEAEATAAGLSARMDDLKRAEGAALRAAESAT